MGRRFTRYFTRQEPIPAVAIDAVVLPDGITLAPVPGAISAAATEVAP
ncbi:hypothetical protein [Sulfitobacter marinus]|nr:hypothetical protein [Sulfitobacter marinus]